MPEDKYRRLQDRARSEDVSVAEAIRRAVDCYLSTPSDVDRELKDFMAFAGLVSDAPDLAENHDKYLSEALDEEHGADSVTDVA